MMNKYEIKAWIKSKSKRYWILTGIIAGFILIGIIAAIVAMYMSGYTIISWFAQFGWMVLICVAIVALVLLGFFFIKFRR